MPISNLAIDASRALTWPRTGTEGYSLEIIRALARLHRRPRLTLYYRRGQDPIDLPEDARRREVAPRRLWTHVGLSTALWRDGAGALFVPAHVIPLVHPKCSVVTIHDLGYVNEPQAHTARSRRMLDWSTRWSTRVATEVIAVSQQTKDDLVRHYAISPERITVVHSGVDRDWFHPIPQADADARLVGLDVRPPYLLFVSTVQPRKNVVRLVEAFERLAQTDLQLVIAGKPGWLSEDIEKRLRNSPARRRIKRLGYIAPEDVRALYCRAAAFVLPSLYEGFGMGVLEAMACGCPVVTSDLSSLPEVAGDAAILVDPHDTEAIRDGITRALDADQRRHLIQRGLRRAAELSWDNTARETLRVIESAADAR